MEFELKKKDFGARIGKLKIGDYEIETPTIMPVINPNLQTLSPEELRDIGAEIVITNSYIIYKNDELRKKALKDGLHELTGFDGPIMTDSGAYQLSVYGDVEVTPKEIIDFQRKIGSDIIVPLDIPTSPDSSKKEANKDLEETLRRLKEVMGDVDNLAGPVQGSVYPELRKNSAEKVSEMNFDYYCIGGVVPMMEEYDFKSVARSIVHSKRQLPLDSPIHLFGAGHPMSFALATALGCDLFDSAAYALFAKRGKYLTNRGTWDINEIKYLPCNCPICRKKEPSELEHDKVALAKHNLFETFKEINTIKEAIRNGEILELAMERSRSHPELLDGLKLGLEEGKSFYEEIAPRSKKRAFFYIGEESLHRPEIKRNKEYLNGMNLDSKKLLILPKDIEIDEKEDTQIIYFNPPFVYPKELKGTYPFGQSLISDINNEKRFKKANNLLRSFLEDKRSTYEEIRSYKLDLEGIEKINKKEIEKFGVIH